MAWYLFREGAAYDPATNALVVAGDLQVFAITDTAFSTPLPIRVAGGQTVTSITSNDVGFFEEFEVEDRTEVRWRSGQYAGTLQSLTAVSQLATTANETATAANNSASTSAGAVTALSGRVTALEAGGGAGGGGGVTDHGALSGLADDDHPQYLTNARGDARYYSRTATDNAIAESSATNSTADRNRQNHTGNQPISSVTNLESRLGALEAGGGGGGAVSSVNGQTGAVNITKSSVGLANADNTSDAAKPVSNATQTALNGKVSGTGVTALVSLTQAAYDALATKSPTTIYVIQGA